MPDAKFGGTPTDTRALYLSDEALKQGVELLILAARDISAQSGKVFLESGLGRAHARAMYFVSRHPGLTVADLLNRLKVTKQSLNRVLSELLSGGYVERKSGTDDKRTRRLFLTPKGATLNDALWRVRRPIVADAFRAAGPEAVDGFRKVLDGLIAGLAKAKIEP